MMLLVLGVDARSITVNIVELSSHDTASDTFLGTTTRGTNIFFAGFTSCTRTSDIIYKIA